MERRQKKSYYIVLTTFIGSLNPHAAAKSEGIELMRSPVKIRVLQLLTQHFEALK